MKCCSASARAIAVKHALYTVHRHVSIPQGIPNLSPYSYFNVMAHDPPYVCLGACPTSGRPNKMKDTQQNLLETK